MVRDAKLFQIRVFAALSDPRMPFPTTFLAFDDGDSMLRLRLVSVSPISTLGHSLIILYDGTDVWQLCRVTCGLCLSVAER